MRKFEPERFGECVLCRSPGTLDAYESCPNCFETLRNKIEATCQSRSTVDRARELMGISMDLERQANQIKRARDGMLLNYWLAFTTGVLASEAFRLLL